MNHVARELELFIDATPRVIASILAAYFFAPLVEFSGRLMTAPAARPVIRRMAVSCIRWGRVLFLAVIGAVVFEVITPYACIYISQLTLPFSSVFVGVVSWLSALVLFHIVSEPIRLRPSQWRGFVWYPSTWLAIPLGWSLAALGERVPLASRPQTGGPDWQHVYPVVPTVVALLIAVMFHQTRSPRRRIIGANQTSEDEAVLTWSVVSAWIAAGERPIAPDERDLFGHRIIASRIVSVVESPGQSVALLGPMGAGKSSILGAVRADLQKRLECVVIAEFDVWAIPRPEDVPRLALNRIIAALDDFVDTIEFRSLPTSYQRLAAAEPTGRLAKMLGLEAASDSIDEIRRLMPVLEALNARMVLIVEDAERAGEAFETRHLQRLLWALRRLDRHSFILAVDPEYAKFDFAKLCETIELVPPLSFRHVFELLNVAYNHWMAEYSYIDPHPKRSEGDKLRLWEATRGGMLEYMQKTGRDTPVDALIALLSSPRALKHVLRQVDRVWRTLHGEAELDDIIIIAALRHRASPAYEFLLADIDPARHKPDDFLPRTKTVKEDWEILLKTLMNGSAVQQLVNLMGVEQLTCGRIPNVALAPQGVHLSEPVDYFRRMVAEDLAPGELRDQTVLGQIDEWKNGQIEPLLNGLLGSDHDDTYSKRWEHFSARNSNEELRELAEQLVLRLLDREGADAAADHQALIGLWRTCNRRLPTNQHGDWLRTQLVAAVPISLQFANGLYYYWAGRHGIVDGETKVAIPQAVVARVRKTFQNADDLVRVLSKERPFQISRLITQTGEQTDAATFEEWREYLAPILIAGAKEHPESFVPELANLASDENSGMIAAKDTYPPVFINRYTIDREKVVALFGEHVDELLVAFANYQDDNAWARRPKAEAERWLAERQNGVR